MLLKDKTIFIAHNWSDISVCQQSKALAFALSENNNVFFLNAKKNLARPQRINQRLEVLNWPGKRPTGIKDFLFAVKLVRKHKPDIIVVNFAATDILLVVSWMFSVKIRVCYFHTMVEQHIEDKGYLSFRQRFNIWRKSYIYKKATHMLPVSTASKKDFIRYFRGIDTKKVHVFANALADTNQVNKSDGQLIGFIGRLDRSKGVDILIEAFVKVAVLLPSVRLVIAGKGVLEEELKAMIKLAGIEDKVEWRGGIAYTEVLKFVSCLSFLVVPSRMDNLPTVVLEAFSTCTPVIGAKTGGIPDMIEDGFNGRLFERENVDDLVVKMKSLLDDEVDRKRMGENARKTFKEKYCIDQLPQRFENLLEGTMN
ncbi:MAG: hypothetical protein JWQ40_2218 [Segetibacter sp.]|nr:hypothetical protein [Segetibacter sp.]